MASYSATMIQRGLTGKLLAGLGSFANINIDGRLSLNAAKQIAKDCFTKEADLRGERYLGFAIEKTERFVDYKNPIICDNEAKAKDIEFLL